MVNLAAEKGASSWLSVLPVAEHGFYLHKTAFRDAIYLRFGWRPERLPEKYICGSSFTVEHALTCNRGGLSFLRHNEIRDLSAKLLTEVCPNVGIELLERPWQCAQQTDRMKPEWTSEHKVSGEKGIRTPFLM